MVRYFFRRIYSSFVTNVFDVPSKLLALLLFMLLLVIPATRPSSYVLLILIIAYIYALFAASWDLLVGRAGQVSLGHALFFGIAAYTSAILSKFYGLPIWATIPLGMLLCALVALLLGFPSLRVKGPYLTLVTLAFPLILHTALFAFDPPVGGEYGIALPPRFFPRKFLLGTEFLAEYYLILFVMFISAIILYKIANSKTGIVLVSILDDESASKACGINVTKYKLLVFVLSALFAGLAGGLYAHSFGAIGSVSPGSVLGLTTSFYPIIMTIFGGIGTIYGPIVGAFSLWTLMEFFQFADELRVLIYISIIIIFILKWPKGVAKFVVEKLDELTEKRELEEREKKK
jgi:branched-chain amino acid transport system permease protein